MKCNLFVFPAIACVLLAHSRRADSADQAASATITVTLPADAVLTVDNVPTGQRGSRRVFETTAVAPGLDFSYTLRAEVVRDGRPVRVSKTVLFRAGAAVTVDLGPLFDRTEARNQEALAGPASAPMPRSAEPGAKEQPVSFATQEQGVLDLTNQERKKADLPPLQQNAKLTRAAREHSANMARLDRLDHVLEGKGPGERLADIGYTSLGWGENVAAGQRTPEEALASWMQSPGHKGNILNQTYTEIGVGIAANDRGGLYYTQVFGRPAGNNDSAAPMQPAQDTPRPEPTTLDEDHIPGLPRGNPPQLQQVKMDKGVLHRMMVFPKFVTKTVTRTVVDKDGKKKEVQEAVYEKVLEGSWQPVKNPRVWDGAGRAIAPERLPEVLKGEAVVLVPVDGGEENATPIIDPMYLTVFSRETLRVYQPPQIPAAPVPGPAPAPRKAVATTPAGPQTKNQVGQETSNPDYQVALFETPQQIKSPPTICLGGLDSKGNLRLRECRESPIQKTAVRKVEKDGVQTDILYVIKSTHLHVTTERFAPADFQAYGADGKALTAADLARALATERAVLICTDPQLPDPIYLKALRPGVPVLVLSRPFGSHSYGYSAAPVPIRAPAPVVPPAKVPSKPAP